MCDTVQSAMLEILNRIQTDVSDVKTRLDGVEREVKAMRRELTGSLVLMRGTAADFDGRVGALELDMHRVKEHLGL